VATAASHGAHAVRAHGLRGAAAEAAAGFPVLFEMTWPTLDAAMQRGWPLRTAQIQAFFATLSVLDDTNLAHRGGLAGLRDAQRAAADYLRGGGAASDDNFERARALHRDFVARGASPGGSADLLAAACWLRRVLEPLPCATLNDPGMQPDHASRGVADQLIPS
jgi:triphosphoribosyl-dephospho-CoA synthase